MYSEIEVIKVSRKDSEVDLPFVIWWPRAVAWAQALELMVNIKAVENGDIDLHVSKFSQIFFPLDPPHINSEKQQNTHQFLMPCSGKGGKACSCPSFTKKDADDSTDNPKYILARFNIKSLADAARREAHQNYHPKGSVETATSVLTGKRSKSAAKKVKMIKVGKSEVLVCGLNRTSALSAQEMEKLFQYHLAKKKGCDDGDLEFGDGWGEREIDNWFRALFPELFEYLDIVYGSGTRHWTLVKKDRFSVVAMKRDTFSSDDLVEAKGSAARGWRDCAVRIATRHALPLAVYKDWPGANAKARAGDRFPSEPPSDTETKTKSKASHQRGKKKGKAKAQSISSDSPESEEPLLSGDSVKDLDHSGVEDIVKQEPELSTAEPRRHRVRVAVKSEKVADHIKVETNIDEEVDDSTRISSGYTRLQHSRRKRSGTLLSNASDQEDRKRHKSSEAPPSRKHQSQGGLRNSSVVASGSSSIASSSATILPPDPSNFVYTARLKRGFDVPKAAFDPWNSK
ncbi:hypothetical protein B0H13DRAFT_1867881 [Mycena leptocephala]|nr:hypothetical protein B0H13DRAFT_1867881 [Mycena leptocephala]